MSHLDEMGTKSATCGEDSRDISRDFALLQKCHCSEFEGMSLVPVAICWDSLWSPFGIETGPNDLQAYLAIAVGIACEARSGLKPLH